VLAITPYSEGAEFSLSHLLMLFT